MRRAQVVDALTRAVRSKFDSDVADALLGDEELVASAAEKLRDVVDDADGVERMIGRVREGTNDALLDWLVDEADEPGAWLIVRCREVAAGGR